MLEYLNNVAIFCWYFGQSTGSLLGGRWYGGKTANHLKSNHLGLNCDSTLILL